MLGVEEWYMKDRDQDKKAEKKKNWFCWFLSGCLAAQFQVTNIQRFKNDAPTCQSIHISAEFPYSQQKSFAVGSDPEQKDVYQPTTKNGKN